MSLSSWFINCITLSWEKFNFVFVLTVCTRILFWNNRAVNLWGVSCWKPLSPERQLTSSMCFWPGMYNVLFEWLLSCSFCCSDHHYFGPPSFGLLFIIINAIVFNSTTTHTPLSVALSGWSPQPYLYCKLNNTIPTIIKKNN